MQHVFCGLQLQAKGLPAIADSLYVSLHQTAAKSGVWELRERLYEIALTVKSPASMSRKSEPYLKQQVSFAEANDVVHMRGSCGTCRLLVTSVLWLIHAMMLCSHNYVQAGLEYISNAVLS